MEAHKSCGRDEATTNEPTKVVESILGQQPTEHPLNSIQSTPERVPVEPPRVALIACACGNSCTFKQDSFVLVREIYNDNSHFDTLCPLYACINCHRQWFACGGKTYLFEPATVIGKLSPEGSQ